jgi:hypothetical protein
MSASTHHFRVGNGDMHLFKLESGRCILVDIRIREGADGDVDDMADVAAQLRDLLGRDEHDRLHVDAFLLSHPDEDHIKGLKTHFHLGPIDDWSEKANKIVIDEMWSSPIVFRRRKRDHVLCDDANAWAVEARRRVRAFEDGGGRCSGERILILGEDIGGKTDDLTDILVKAGQRFDTINGQEDDSFAGFLLGPITAADEEEAEMLSKNDSSVVVQFTIAADGESEAARYLLGGDARVGVWEKVWDQYGDDPSVLAYDVLIAPHHCSWRSLSWQSWSTHGEDAEVSMDARSALAQARSGAVVLASSKPVKDGDGDPPCIRAKREYVSIVKPKGGEFRCVADGADDEPFVFSIGWAGPKIKRVAGMAAAGVSTGIGTEAMAHG